MGECNHKFKILKEFERTSKNLMGNEKTETVYHLQCEKCGVMKTQICDGFEEGK